jgi:predicted small secreted protein
MRNIPQTLGLTTAALLLAACANVSQPQGGKAPGEKPASQKVEIFNRRDLTGLKPLGGTAPFVVSPAGTLVGTAVANTPNTFLATEGTYANFVLEYDYKHDAALNSGVQFRSRAQVKEAVPAAAGKPAQQASTRVVGYQCEIDASPRMWSAGLYEEGMRKWIFPGLGGGDAAAFTKQGQEITKVGAWNHVKVEANGHRIRTWLNGVPRADVRDDGFTEGFIAFQVHGIGKDVAHAGTKVEWRNITLTKIPDNTLSPSEKADGWKLLFDGRTSKGWRSAKGPAFPQAGWSVEAGTLRTAKGDGKESANAGDIITVARFKEFEVSVDFRLTPGANSGLKYFVQPNLNQGAGSAFGLEFQMLDDALHPDAKLGRDGNRTVSSLYDLKTASKDKRPNAIGEWNNAYVIAKGTKVEHWLNGRLVVSYDRGTAEFRELVAKSKYADPKYGKNFGEWADGHILLQEHGDEVWFKNIKLRDLAAKPAAKTQAKPAAKPASEPAKKEAKPAAAKK